MKSDPRFTIVASALITLAASAPALAQDAVRIGMVVPLTGALAFDGQQNVQGARMAIDEINASGKLKAKLELVVEDGQCKPAESLSAAEKLIERDKVVAFEGAFCSGATQAVMSLADKNGVPMVTGVSALPKLTQVNNRWFFRTAENEDITARAFAKLLAADMKVKSVYYLGMNDDWGRGSVVAFKNLLEKQNVKTAGTDYFDPAANEFYTTLTKVKGSRADAVFVAAVTQSGSTLVRQAKELGLKSRIFGVGAWATPTFLNLAGDASEGILAGVVYTPSLDNADNKDFVQRFEKRYQIKPGKYGAAGYTSVSVIAQAIGRAPQPTRAAVRDALEKTDFKAPNGRLRFDGNRQAYGFEMALIEIVKKEPVVRAVATVSADDARP